MWKYARITMQTAGGNRVDIVSDVSQVVSGSYILYGDLPKFVKRVEEFGITLLDLTALKVLAAENLFHFRTDL